MAEAAFSDDGKYFSALSQDGRLRIWDTESNVLKQEYTPDLHLTSPPSCLQWLGVSQSVGPSQKGAQRISNVKDQETQCIALGTISGKILIYSVSQAKVETVLVDEKNNEIHRNFVTSLDWHRDYGLYSCSKENSVCEWDLQSAKVRNKYNVNVQSKNKQANNVSAIKIVPHKQNTPARYLVTSSWQVRVWRLHNGDSELVKCLGHNAAPKALLALTTLNNVCWLIQGSQNERLLSFWDVTVTDDIKPQVNGDEITPNKKKRRKSISAATSFTTVETPTYYFVLEDAPKVLDVRTSEEDGGVRLCLAAATRSGVVHYYGHMLNGTSTKPIKPSVTIQVTTADAQPLPLHCCRLPPTGDLQLGYTQGLIMLFEKVTPDLKSKTQVLIRDTKESKKKKNKLKNEVNKVRADLSQDQVTYVEPMGGVSRKRPTPGGKVEVPMEERLANLTVDLKGRSKAAVNQNLSKLLMQGLHSKDRRIILMVLQRDEPGVAQHTVAGLPADYVPQLLDQLAEMCTRKTSQCAAVCTWVSAVLRCHAALLLATASARSSDQLTRLLTVFSHRRSHLCQLLNLKGRLELTMSQREARDAATPHAPVLEYKDTSSDEEMEEAERSASSDGSEHSWRDHLDSDQQDSDHHDSDGSARTMNSTESDGD